MASSVIGYLHQRHHKPESCAVYHATAARMSRGDGNHQTVITLQDHPCQCGPLLKVRHRSWYNQCCLVLSLNPLHCQEGKEKPKSNWAGTTKEGGKGRKRRKRKQRGSAKIKTMPENCIRVHSLHCPHHSWEQVFAPWQRRRCCTHNALVTFPRWDGCEGAWMQS